MIRQRLEPEIWGSRIWNECQSPDMDEDKGISRSRKLGAINRGGGIVQCHGQRKGV